MSGTSPRPARRRTAKRGRSLQWNDEAIEQVSQVGPQDVDSAEASWERFAPREARGLMRAREDEDERSIG